MGQHPRQIKKMLRDFAIAIKGLNISIVATKQVYRGGQDHLMRGEGVYVVNDSFRYPCSQIILVSRLKLKDDSTKQVTGIRLKATGFKTRFTLPFQEVEIEVPYDTGMDPWSGMFEVALALGVVVKPSTGWYSIAGETEKWREREFVSRAAEKVLALCEEKSSEFLNVRTEDFEEDLESEGPSVREKKNEMYGSDDSE